MIRSIARLSLVGAFLVCSSAWAGDITVSAAASLTNAFKEMATEFEARHPGSKVLLNFGASGALLQQMAKGAPVDVFASADQETMDQAQGQGLIEAASRSDFTRNALVLIVPAASTLSFGALTDLTRPEVKQIAMGNPAVVPNGRYAKRALEGASLWSSLEGKIINAQNVRQALDYVARGEVEAGFVFATDAAIMKDKVKVAFPVELDGPISYPIAKTTASKQGAEAQQLIDFILSSDGQAVLARYGFKQR